MQEIPSTKNSPTSTWDFIRAVITPTLIGKSLILYFGLNYSESPGEGYGYGLVASIAFTVIMLLLFIWKYRNYTENTEENS